MRDSRNLGLLALGSALILGGAGFHFATAGGRDPAPADASAPAAVATDPDASATAAFPEPDPSLPVMQVWKSATCGCCSAWIDHLRAAGFRVEAHDVQDLDGVKTERGVPEGLRACHTAVVGDYVVEGHVPAEDIVRLLEDAPEGVAGLAVPGMPLGSPGMDMGDRHEAYETLAFRSDGTTTVWAEH